MLEQYYRISKAVGVNINTDPAGNSLINACSVHIQSNQLNFEQKISDIDKFDELTKYFPLKSVIALNLSGKGVLIKKIAKTAEINSNNFSKILPNGNLEDYYLQNFISGDHSFISVIRKAEADKWTGRLKELGFIPLMLSLGPFPVQNIIPQLNVYGNEIIFAGNIIDRDEQSQWTGYRFDESAAQPFVLKVESEIIDEKLVIPYAAAFQLVLASKLAVIQAWAPSLETEFQKRLTTNQLKVKSFIVLAVLFILLLVNFILFSSLDTANAQLANQVSRSAQSTNDIQGITDKIKEKEGLLQSLGWEGGINKSAMIDQIAAMLPPEVTWKEVAIDPIDLPATRVQKLLVFYNRRIRITGNSQNIAPVNEWMARVKTKSWIKNLQLESYTYNNEFDTGQFTIVIDY
jgi:Tfp pilus assembly protein PilN